MIRPRLGTLPATLPVEPTRIWEQAYEREQGAPATVEAKQASTTYTALQTRRKLAAAQLQEIQGDIGRCREM